MPTSIRLPDKIERRLEYLADKTGRTKAFYIREMILEGIDDIEDYYLAANRMERVRRGKEPTLTARKARKSVLPVTS